MSSIEKSKFESRESIKSAMLHTSLMSFFGPTLPVFRCWSAVLLASQRYLISVLHHLADDDDDDELLLMIMMMMMTKMLSFVVMKLF